MRQRWVDASCCSPRAIGRGLPLARRPGDQSHCSEAKIKLQEKVLPGQMVSCASLCDDIQESDWPRPLNVKSSFTSIAKATTRLRGHYPNEDYRHAMNSEPCKICDYVHSCVTEQSRAPSKFA